MAVTYHFDLYPRNDPRDGTRIVRFTMLQAAEYRAEANGTGVGRLSIRADEAEAQNIDPAGLQYVRVVRDDGSTELVVGGFWLENGDFEALTEKENRLLTFSGSGTIAYLQRAIMWSHVYYPGGEDPIGGAYYSIPGAGQTVGYILWRWVYQATLYRVGTTPYLHEHADGTVATDIHDDDRRENPLPYLTIGFDGDEDSDGNPWSIGFSSQRSLVGDSLLQAVRVLMQSGLYLEMDPDTFELRAWESATHRRDRSGGAWGANVVRFQAPTDGTTATGNIKSDATRGIAAFVKRSAVLAGSVDTYAVSSTGGSPIPWEGYVSGAPEDTAALGELATAQIAARSDAGDVSRLRMKLGNDPSNGVYMPWEHVLLDDVVTVHTGTAQWDFNEDTFPVAALTVILRPAGDWDAYVDLGASFTSMVERAFQTAPVGNHSHPPNPLLCNDEVTNEGGLDVLINFDWEPGPLTVETIPAYAGISQPAKDLTGNDIFGGDQGISLAGTLDWVWIHVTPGTSYQIDLTHYVFTHLSGGSGWAEVQWMGGSYPFDDADQVGASEYTQLVPRGAYATTSWTITAPSGAVGFRIKQGTHPTITPSRGWHINAIVISEVIAGGISTPGSRPLDTVHQGQETHGTSTRATRCDHQHAHGLLSTDGTAYHDANPAYAIPITDAGGYFTGDDVEAALQELGSGGASHPDLATHDALGLATDAELAAHTGDTTDAHDASAISIVDSGAYFTATDVEGALQELGAGGGGGGGGGSLSYQVNTLSGSDVALGGTNTFADACSLTLAAGTWLLTAHITFRTAATVLRRYVARIYDGTNVLASGEASHPSQNPNSVQQAISVVAVLGGSTTIKLQGRQAQGTETNAFICATTVDGAEPGATKLTAIKIA